MRHRGLPAGQPGLATDCNDNGFPDECDIASGRSLDEDEDGVPDECTACVTGDANCERSWSTPSTLTRSSSALADPGCVGSGRTPVTSCARTTANADGLVNSFDIDPFVLLLAGGGK